MGSRMNLGGRREGGGGGGEGSLAWVPWAEIGSALPLSFLLPSRLLLSTITYADGNKSPDNEESFPDADSGVRREASGRVLDDVFTSSSVTSSYFFFHGLSQRHRWCELYRKSVLSIVGRRASNRSMEGGQRKVGWTGKGR